MPSRVSRASVEAVRKISIVGLKATSIAVKVLRESEKEDYKGWAESAVTLIKGEAERLVRTALDPRAGWVLLKNAISPDVREATRKKYATNLPWPQPSPISFDGLAQTVLNVPDEEIQEFLDVVVSRYVKTLRKYWIEAGAYAMQFRGLDAIDDNEFANLVERTSFSRFLCSTLDAQDRIDFAPFLKSDLPSGQFYKVDFSCLSNLNVLPEMYLSPTVTLFEKQSGGALIPRAIKINGIVIQPKDANAWELARYFVLQGAAIAVVAGIHPTVHFPMDAINALTKSVLPTGHLVRRLLEPHLYMQLPLNYAVLHIDRSVAHNNQREIYTPFPFPKESFFQIMQSFHRGIPGNSAYPPYQFPLAPPQIHSDYGNFLKLYYDVILGFVTDVTSTIKKRDPYVRRWAHHISVAVPGFPGSEKILQGDNLARALTSFICSVSVIHSADHYSYGDISVNKVPLRMRQPSPASSKIASVNRKNLVNWEDIFRHRMAREMYFKPSTVKRLMDVGYHFETEEQRDAADRFHEQIRELDESLGENRFVPLDQISSSIQY